MNLNPYCPAWLEKIDSNNPWHPPGVVSASFEDWNDAIWANNPPDVWSLIFGHL